MTKKISDNDDDLKPYQEALKLTKQLINLNTSIQPYVFIKTFLVIAVKYFQCAGFTKEELIDEFEELKKSALKNFKE